MCILYRFNVTGGTGTERLQYLMSLFRVLTAEFCNAGGRRGSKTIMIDLTTGKKNLTICRKSIVSTGDTTVWWTETDGRTDITYQCRSARHGDA